MSRLEKLTVVLFVDTCFDDEVIIDSQEFARPEPQSGVSAYMILQKILDFWPDLSGKSALKRTDGSVLSISDLSSRLKSGGQWGGPLAFGGFKVHIAELPAMMQIIVTVEETMDGPAGSWESWVRPFLCEQAFVQAWIADVEYDYWQNASDPLEYEAAGRSYRDLPMKSNELPFPLQRDIIDVTSNPARMEIKQGYVEAIGSRVWIGKLFWRNSGTSPDALLHLPKEFTVHSIDCDVNEVVFSGECFDSDETVDAQRRLRENLYGIV